MPSRTDASFHWRRYLAPKFWATWMGFGLFWLISRLPYRLVMAVSANIGNLMFLCLRSRQRITLINLRLAFPELSESKRLTLARNSFRQVGMAIGETAWIWHRPVAGVTPSHFDGAEHVDAALAAGKGVILLQAHFTVLELCSAILGARWPAQAVYDTPKNPMFAEYLLYQRGRHLTGLINNRSIREMVRALRRGEMVWYSPDQSVALEHGGIETRYFDQPVLTTSGTARIVSMTGCTVIPFVPTRNDNGNSYTFTFHAPLTFDSVDPVQATQQVNDRLEQQVRAQPEQYLWAHKRFKPPTTEHTNPYA